MAEQTTALEEQLAHLIRSVEELSDVVGRQAREIAALQRRVGLLLEREAGREADDADSVALADQKPPHW